MGNGQGDSKGPSRSMEALAIETRAVEWLVAGCAFRAPMGVARRRTPSCWLADDGAFQVDSFATLQMTFTVMSVMARVLGFTVGIDADADGTPNGDKTDYEVTVEIEVKVPLVGGKLTGFGKGIVEKQLSEELTLGDSWLADN